MKKFEFDAKNNLLVKELNILLEPVQAWSLSDEQIKKHQVMFDTEMTVSEKTKCNDIFNLIKK